MINVRSKGSGKKVLAVDESRKRIGTFNEKKVKKTAEHQKDLDAQKKTNQTWALGFFRDIWLLLILALLLAAGVYALYFVKIHEKWGKQTAKSGRDMI